VQARTAVMTVVEALWLGDTDLRQWTSSQPASPPLGARITHGALGDPARSNDPVRLIHGRAPRTL
ncbi:MAG: hypothetical protein V4812_12865, partial [Pseudomonadota bacterium]